MLSDATSDQISQLMAIGIGRRSARALVANDVTAQTLHSTSLRRWRLAREAPRFPSIPRAQSVDDGAVISDQHDHLMPVRPLHTQAGSLFVGLGGFSA